MKSFFGGFLLLILKLILLRGFLDVGLIVFRIFWEFEEIFNEICSQVVTLFASKLPRSTASTSIQPSLPNHQKLKPQKIYSNCNYKSDLPSINFLSDMQWKFAEFSLFPFKSKLCEEFAKKSHVETIFNFSLLIGDLLDVIRVNNEY